MWKVKLTLMLWLFLPLPTSPNEYDQTNVESFTVGRMNRDKFLINMKSSYPGQCRGEWCSQVFDGVYLTIITGNCQCQCDTQGQMKSTFLPSMQKCVSASAARIFGGECNRGREPKGPSACAVPFTHGQYKHYKLNSTYKQKGEWQRGHL